MISDANTKSTHTRPKPNVLNTVVSRWKHYWVVIVEVFAGLSEMSQVMICLFLFIGYTFAVLLFSNLFVNKDKCIDIWVGLTVAIGIYSGLKKRKRSRSGESITGDGQFR